jgi:hypothetical protein
MRKAALEPCIVAASGALRIGLDSDSLLDEAGGEDQEATTQ